MDRIKSVKGMHDLFEEQLSTWRVVERVAQDTFLAFGYGEIRTPVLEKTPLFVRGVGETSDIVSKEMFRFDDQGGDGKVTDVCLRPENTAAVVRALLQAGKLTPDSDERVFYMGPMFRRERPAKGRFRQFHQFGAEAFGFTRSSIDVEMMAMVHTLIDELGSSGVSLLINTLGDAEDRVAYTAALKDYYQDHFEQLSDDAKERLEKNPLRLLDGKEEILIKLAQDAPKIGGYLGDAARAHFDEVQEGLTRLNVPFVVEEKLVRGLDYYTRTVFEAVADSGLGAQNAVAAGGRYDGLVQQLGGKPMPGVGFAAGIERLVLLLENAKKTQLRSPARLMFIAADDAGRHFAEPLALALRKQGVKVELDHRGGKMKAQIRRADRANISFVVVLGTNEVESGKAQLKEMATGDVNEVDLNPESLLNTLRTMSAHSC
ncbi:MAG: histidine--tRNA ligase [Deltaproteobacteria bacterium]|nr:histidine--tRNA ligase [Deltaproteobacteria bacterium]